MWLAAIILLALVPVSWIGVFILWHDWMTHLEHGYSAGVPMYVNVFGLLSLVYVALQVVVIIARIRELIRTGE